MTRFYGSAIFEGYEVADDTLAQLNGIRDREAAEIIRIQKEVAARIVTTQTTGDDRIRAIRDQTVIECEDIDADVEELIQEQITNCESAIVDMEDSEEIEDTRRAHARYIAIIREWGETEKEWIRNDAETRIRKTEDEVRSAIYDIELWGKKREEEIHAEAEAKIEDIRRAHDRYIIIIREWGETEKEWIRNDAKTRVQRIEDEVRNAIYDIESWGKRREVEIHAEATADIDSILASRRIETVYKVLGESTACNYCLAKIGTIGTMEMLKAQDCIPPFHAHCKCYLFEVGYCLLSGI